MAIKLRRGQYDDLDTSRLVQGEPFMSLDPLPDGDIYVGVTISPSNVVRLATWTNLETVLNVCEGYRDDAKQSADDAQQSADDSEESNKQSEAWAVGQRGGVDVPDTDPTYENNSKYYSEQSKDYWDKVHDAVEFVTPKVEIDFETGELISTGSALMYYIDPTDGFLCWNIATT